MIDVEEGGEDGMRSRSIDGNHAERDTQEKSGGGTEEEPRRHTRAEEIHIS